MRLARPATALLLGLTLAAGAQAARGSQARLEFFRMPSKNIGSLLSTSPTELRCDVLSGVKPKPRGTCELDWTGYAMRPTGRAGPNCAGDTVYNNRAPILRYGQTWRRGGFTCRSSAAALRCTNRTGHGFSLSRQRSYTF